MIADFKKLTTAINKGVDFLYEHQYPSGEFCCYIASDDDMQNDITTDSCVFPTAVIGLCLQTLPKTIQTARILEKICIFLQYQMMRGGVWNFFTVRNPLFKVNPPDLDTTVMASKVLIGCGVEFPDNERIFLYNRSRNGLFYTWITTRLKNKLDPIYLKLILREFKYPIRNILYWTRNESGKYDIDGVVNANVLYALGLNEDTRGIIPFLKSILYTNAEDDCDKWYRNPFTYYYFLSRNFNRGIDELVPEETVIIEKVLARASVTGLLGDSLLDTALGATALINAGYRGDRLDKAIHLLLESQNVRGYWPRRSFYYSGPSKAMGWGSEELTTAYCLEAIMAYIRLRYGVSDKSS